MTDPKTTPDGGPASSQARAVLARDKRRAEALRANLQRRKEQTRARRARTDAALKKTDKSGGKSE